MAERLTREQQREQNRFKLLMAAEKVFAERGIQGASLDEVAAEAGLTKGAVYSNFSSKEELIQQVFWHRQGTPEAADFAKLWSSGAPPEQMVEGYSALWAAAARAGERDAFARLSLEYIAHALRHPEAKEKLLAFLSPAEEQLEPGAHRFAPEGSELAKIPPGHVNTILQALDLGLSALKLLDPERHPPELYGVALRLLAGMEVPEDQVPPVAEHEDAPGPQDPGSPGEQRSDDTRRSAAADDILNAPSTPVPHEPSELQREINEDRDRWS